MKNDSGFTLVETLCAVALFAILAWASGLLIYNTRRTTEDSRRRSARQFRQLHIERLMREAAEEIAIPYWEKGESALPLARETVLKSLSRAGYEGILETETLRDAAGRVTGIRCRLSIDGQVYDGYGLFASIPLKMEP